MANAVECSAIEVTPYRHLVIGYVPLCKIPTIIGAHAQAFGPVARFALRSGLSDNADSRRNLEAMLLRLWAHAPAILDTVIDVASGGAEVPPDLSMSVKLQALGAAARHTLERYSAAEIGATISIALAMTTAAPNLAAVD